MTKLHQLLAGFAVIVAVAAVSIVGTMTAEKLVPTPKVPLTTGLSGSWSSVNSEFNRRVTTAFPPGSFEADMGRELMRQGFSRMDWASTETEHEAVRREDNWVCRQAAHIYWRGDVSGRISAVRGEYSEAGCL
jgi:Flp pilus assembly pilin Flp